LTPEICIVELGGTVGDIESSVFLEAIRQFQDDHGPENVQIVKQIFLADDKRL
jgi:CTP synthase